MASSMSKTLVKDFGIGLPVAIIYLGLFTLIEATSLLILTLLSGGSVLSSWIQYVAPVSVFVMALNLFLGLGLWLCSTDLVQKKSNFLSFLHLPLFKVAVLSLLPALGLLPILFLLGPFGFFMGFLWGEIVGVFFLSAVLAVFRDRSPGRALWSISKHVYIAHRTSILGVGLCLAIGQVAFISFVSENDMQSALAFTALFFPLLLIHFRVLFHGIRFSFDAYTSKEKVNKVSAHSERHGIFSPALIVSVMAGGVFFSINNLQQRELDARFKNFNERIRTQQVQNKYQRPVLRGEALVGNGNEAYWEVIGKAASSETERQQEYVVPVSFFYKNYPDLAEAFEQDREIFKTDRGIQSQPVITAKYMPVIQALQTAAAHEYIQHDYAYDINAPLPNFLNAQGLAAIMTSLAITQCQNGHCLAGGELFMDTLRLGQDIEYRGTLIDGMVGIVMKDKTLRAGLAQLNHQNLNEQELKILTSRMETLLRSEKSLEQTLANEFLLLEKIIYDLNQKPREAPALFAQLSATSYAKTDSLFAPLFFNPFLKPIMLDALNTLGLIRSKYDSIYLLPRSQQKKAIEDFNVELEQTLASNLILAVAFPNLIGGWEREMNAHLAINAAYIYLALETYRAEKGSYPEHLEGLVPDIVPKLPLDPWTDQTFYYNLLTPETFAFYSFGKAGKLGKTTAYLDPSKQHCKNESTLIFSNVFVTPPLPEQTDLSPCENNIHFLVKG